MSEQHTDDFAVSLPLFDESRDPEGWQLPPDPILGELAGRCFVILRPGEEARHDFSAEGTDWEVSFTLMPGLRDRLARPCITVATETGELAVQFRKERVVLAHLQGEDTSRIATAPHLMTARQIYHVHLLSAHGSLRLLINGMLALEADDLPPFAAASVGLSTLPMRGDQSDEDDNLDTSAGYAELHADLLAEHHARRHYDEWHGGHPPFYPWDEIDVEPSPDDLSAPPSKATKDKKRVIPLLVEKYDQFHGYKINGMKRQRKFVNTVVNPGPVPPNFVHTWAFNCKNIKSFRPHFREVTLDGQDIIKFYVRWSFLQQNAKGDDLPPVPIAYWRAQDVKPHWLVKLDGHDEDVSYAWGKSVLTYTRLYVQLETSSKHVKRRFVIDGFETETPAPKGKEEGVYLVGDDVRYTSSKGQILVASEVSGTVLQPVKDASGKVVSYQKIDIHKDVPLSPWWTGQNPLKIPKAADGWYLLNEHLKDNGQGFFAVTYYNEITSRLRIYLYDHQLAKKHTAFNVRVSLLGQAQKGGSYKELTGAIVPVHTNPFLWSDTTLPLQTLQDIQKPSVGNVWSANKWGAVELPLLIPMVDKIPVAGPHPLGAKKSPAGTPYYRSVYDEALKVGMRSVKLKIEVCPFDEGTIKGDWTGKATGEAIQKMKSDGDDPVQTAKDWMETGVSIADGAKKGWDKFSEWYTQNEDPNKKGSPKDSSINGGIVAFKAASKIVSTGLSIFSGGLGAAGSVLDLAADLFGFGPKTQPMELSLKLSMDGTLKGTQIVSFTPRQITFYLPGRVAIDEIVQNDELALSDQRAIDSALPRYDRRVGLFGYMYNPADVTFRMLRYRKYFFYHEGDPEPPKTDAFRYIYPTTFAKNPKYAKLKPGQGMVPDTYSDTVNYALPVIYNPYAEVVPAAPVTTGSSRVALYKQSDFKIWPVPLNMGQIDDNWWRRKYWTYDLSWPTHIPKPETGDVLPSAPRKLEEGFYMRVTVYGYEEYSDASTIYWHDWTTPMGHMMQIVPKSALRPQLFHSFKQLYALEHSDHILDVGASYPYYDMPKWIGTLDEKKKYAPKHAIWPIYHVMFTWRHPYFYYARSRQRADGIVPKSAKSVDFRAPITVETREWSYPQGKPKLKTFLCHSDIGRPPV